MVVGLPADGLTEQITGSTIKTAKTETTTANAVFFKAVAPLIEQHEEGQSWRRFVIENVLNAEH